MKNTIEQVLVDNEHTEAMQFGGDFNALEEFVGGDAEWRDHQFVVASVDGALRGHVGDWVLHSRGAWKVVTDAEFKALKR